MSWLTHGMAALAGAWVGIVITLSAVTMAPDRISKILNHTLKG